MDLSGYISNKNLEMTVPSTIVYDHLFPLDTFNLRRGDARLLEKVAKHVETNMRVTQKTDGQFQLLNQDETLEYYNADINALNRHKYAKYNKAVAPVLLTAKMT